MRIRWLVVAAGLSVFASSTSWAQWSLLDAVEVLDPNLSAEVIWELNDVNSYCGSGTPGLDAVACERVEELVANTNPSIFAARNNFIGLDAEGNWYGVSTQGVLVPGFWEIYRRQAGTRIDELIVRIVGPDIESLLQVNAEQTEGWTVDPVNGVILLIIRGQCKTNDCRVQGNDQAHMALIRITGLPTVLDVVPEGPPGMTGPPGPPGPPADESRVTTLETLVATQQAEIDALRTTLDQIENPPTIQRLLEKVQELEGAAP